MESIFTYFFILLTTVGCFTNAGRPLSVHVLDNTSGGNAVNITCRGYRENEDGFKLLSTQITNGAGRVLELVPSKDFVPGTYRIWLNTKEYFESQNLTTFWPAVELTFKVQDPYRENHIPIALSPFSFSTYRGA